MKYIKNEKIDTIKVNEDYIQTKNCNKTQGREVDYIVMHYTGNKKDTAVNNAKYFYNNSLNASAHFFVDEECIYQSVALKDVAWHVGTKGKYLNGCRNNNSIGIEMCCVDNYSVGEKTVDRAIDLVVELCRMLDIGEEKVCQCVVRHYDVTGKKCPKEWVEDEDRFVRFREEVKAKLKDELWDIKGHWAEKDIMYLYEKGIITGYEDKSFKPDKAITKAEVASMIAKII